MLAMNVFENNAFSAIEMTMAVDRMGYVPGALQSIPGLIAPVSVATTSVFIEQRGNAPALIQTTPRGAPPQQKGGDLRNAKNFRTVRLAMSSRVTAEELQNIRAFGSQTELTSLQIELARRIMKMKQDFSLTKENMLLGVVQGKAVDADGSVIYDWGTEFSQAQPAEVAFDLSNASPSSGSIRKLCSQIKRTMTRNLQGLGGNSFDIAALVGDQFWDQLTSAKEVRETYLNWAAAADLRGDVGGPWKAFRYGDINFVNYRGTDDGAVGVATDKAKFFPLGAGIFQYVLSPGESFEFVNTPGKDMYSWVVLDRELNSWVDVHLRTYPLPVCVQPQALASGRAGA